MLTLLKKLLNNKNQRDITSIQETNRLSACILLLEAAHIDDECTDELSPGVATPPTGSKPVSPRRTHGRPRRGRRLVNPFSP